MRVLSQPPSSGQMPIHCPVLTSKTISSLVFPGSLFSAYTALTELITFNYAYYTCLFLLDDKPSRIKGLPCVQLSATPGTATRQAPLSFTISWSLLKFISGAIYPSHPLPPLLLLPSTFPIIRYITSVHY